MDQWIKFWSPNVVFRRQIRESNCPGHLDRFELPGTFSNFAGMPNVRGRWSLRFSRVSPLTHRRHLSRSSLSGARTNAYVYVSVRMYDVKPSRLAKRRNPSP